MASTKKNYLYNLVFQATTLGFTLFVTPYITRTLGDYNNGVYSYTYSVANYFLLFAMLGLNNYGNRSIAYVRTDEENLKQTFSSIYAMQFLTSLTAVAVYIVYGLFLAKSDLMIVWIQLVYLLSAMFDINWFFYGLERFKLVMTRNIVIKLMTMAAVFLFVKKPEDLWLYTLIMALGYFVPSLVLWPYIFRHHILKRPAPGSIIRHLKPNLVLFIPVVAISVYNVMDKIMLGIMSTKEQVAYYDNAEKIMAIPSALIVTLGTVMMPKMSGLVKEGKQLEIRKFISNSMQFAVLTSCAAGFGLAAISPVFTPVFYGKQFLPCAPLIVGLAPIALIKAWANVIRTQYLIPNCRDRVYVVSTVLGALINVVVNLLLIRQFQALGAVVGTVMAELSVMLYQTVKVRKELPIGSYLKKNWGYLLIGVVMFFILRLMQPHMSSSVGSLVLQILIGGVIYVAGAAVYLLLNKDPVLKEILRKFLKKY